MVKFELLNTTTKDVIPFKSQQDILKYVKAAGHKVSRYAIRKAVKSGNSIVAGLFIIRKGGSSTPGPERKKTKPKKRPISEAESKVVEKRMRYRRKKQDMEEAALQPLQIRQRNEPMQETVPSMHGTDRKLPQPVQDPLQLQAFSRQGPGPVNAQQVAMEMAQSLPDTPIEEGDHGFRIYNENVGRERSAPGPLPIPAPPRRPRTAADEPDLIRFQDEEDLIQFSDDEAPPPPPPSNPGSPVLHIGNDGDPPPPPPSNPGSPVFHFRAGEVPPPPPPSNSGSPIPNDAFSGPLVDGADSDMMPPPPRRLPRRRLDLRQPGSTHGIIDSDTDEEMKAAEPPEAPAAPEAPAVPQSPESTESPGHVKVDAQSRKRPLDTSTGDMTYSEWTLNVLPTLNRQDLTPYQRWMLGPPPTPGTHAYAMWELGPPPLNADDLRIFNQMRNPGTVPTPFLTPRRVDPMSSPALSPISRHQSMSSIPETSSAYTPLSDISLRSPTGQTPRKHTYRRGPRSKRDIGPPLAAEEIQRNLDTEDLANMSGDTVVGTPAKRRQHIRFNQSTSVLSPTHMASDIETTPVIEAEPTRGRARRRNAPDPAVSPAETRGGVAMMRHRMKQEEDKQQSAESQNEPAPPPESRPIRRQQAAAEEETPSPPPPPRQSSRRQTLAPISNLVQQTRPEQDRPANFFVHNARVSEGLDPEVIADFKAVRNGWKELRELRTSDPLDVADRLNHMMQLGAMTFIPWNSLIELSRAIVEDPELLNPAERQGYFLGFDKRKGMGFRPLPPSNYRRPDVNFNRESLETLYERARPTEKSEYIVGSMKRDKEADKEAQQRRERWSYASSAQMGKGMSDALADGIETAENKKEEDIPNPNKPEIGVAYARPGVVPESMPLFVPKKDQSVPASMTGAVRAQLPITEGEVAKASAEATDAMQRNEQLQEAEEEAEAEADIEDDLEHALEDDADDRPPPQKEQPEQQSGSGLSIPDQDSSAPITFDSDNLLYETQVMNRIKQGRRVDPVLINTSVAPQSRQNVYRAFRRPRKSSMPTGETFSPIRRGGRVRVYDSVPISTRNIMSLQSTTPGQESVANVNPGPPTELGRQQAGEVAAGTRGYPGPRLLGQDWVDLPVGEGQGAHNERNTVYDRTMTKSMHINPSQEFVWSDPAVRQLMTTLGHPELPYFETLTAYHLLKGAAGVQGYLQMDQSMNNNKKMTRALNSLMKMIKRGVATGRVPEGEARIVEDFMKELNESRFKPAVSTRNYAERMPPPPPPSGDEGDGDDGDGDDGDDESKARDPDDARHNIRARRQRGAGFHRRVRQRTGKCGGRRAPALY